MLPPDGGAISDEGADVVWVEGDYDAAVRRAAEFADAEPGRALVQDTAWHGYEQVPAWIVQGYDTLLAEVDEALGAGTGSGGRAGRGRIVGSRRWSAITGARARATPVSSRWNRTPPPASSPV